MTKQLVPVFLLLASLFTWQACNPECESLPSTNIDVPTGPYEQGSELALVSNPPNLLDGRTLHLSLRGGNNSNARTIALDSRFESALGAAVVQLPDEITTNATFLVDDPDCSGNLVPIGTSSSLVDANFFSRQSFFHYPDATTDHYTQPTGQSSFKDYQRLVQSQQPGLLYLV